MYWNGVHFGLKKSTPIHFGMVARCYGRTSSTPHSRYTVAVIAPRRTYITVYLGRT